MLKVLHLIHTFNQGGIEKWLISILKHIPRSELEMDFCCKGPDIGPLGVIAQDLGAKVFHCPLGLAHFGFAQDLQNILETGNYQILHNHVETYSGFPVWVAKQLGIPVITSFHNIKFDPQTSFTRHWLIRKLRSLYGSVSIAYALHHSHLITGCSQGVLQSLPSDLKKIKNSPQVLYYGVNLPKLSILEERIAFRQSFNWSPDTPLILHVGRLIEQKNHLTLLSIFQLVLEKIPTAKLLLVGDGLLQNVIEDNIAQRGLEKSVKLLGKRNDVTSLMSKCDVFLFPSLYEGFGLVLIEANSAKLPIVATKIPGITEAIIDGKTGRLHDVEDIQGMALSVIRLINDPCYSQQIANTAREWVEEKYSIAISAKNLLEIYHKVEF